MIFPYLFVYNFERSNPGGLTSKFHCPFNHSISAEEKNHSFELNGSTSNWLIFERPRNVIGVQCSSYECDLKFFSDYFDVEFEQWLAMAFRDMNCIDLTPAAAEEKLEQIKVYRPYLLLALELQKNED